MIKYPQIQKSIVLSLLFFLVASASYGSTIIGVNPVNGLVNQWWKILLVSSKYKNTTTTPVFFIAEDLDSDNDGIPNSIEDQECFVSGLHYEFYKNDKVRSTEDIKTTGAFSTGITSELDVVKLRKEVHKAYLYVYSIRYTGYIYIPRGGEYTFYLYSDDGSQLYIDQDLIVDNDNVYLHNDKVYKGSVRLSKGFHSFKMLYFDVGGSQWLDFEYKGPGISRRNVPSSVYRTTSAHKLPNGAPCNDNDNDGIINSLDLDSDNDGIYDAEEAGHGAAHINGVVRGAVGSDGIPDAVQTGSELNYTILDTDRDGVPNFLDADSDGDRCPDVKEAGFVESASTPGTLSGTGVNSNGTIKVLSTGYTPPTDANLNGVKDYQEVGSVAIISSQPNALETCVGKSFSLSVNSNIAYQYQWQYLSGSSWINLTNSTNISGANTNQLTILSAKKEHLEVQYRVQVLDGSFLCGTKVNSNIVRIGIQYCSAVTNRRITYRAKNNF